MPGYPCCCGRRCDDCSGTRPGSYSVTLGGFAGTCPGGDCTDLNDTFIVEFTPGIAGECQYSYTFPAPVCLHDPLTLEWTTSGGDYILQVSLFRGGGSTVWQKNYGAVRPSCNVTAESLTLTLAAPFDPCGTVGLTCEVTAL